AAAALDRHRLAFHPEVRRRNAPAAIDERKFERLSVGEVRETRLLDRRDVDKHVLAAVIANDEAESLLRIEKFDDAFAFANDLGRHPTAAAAAAAAETSPAPTAKATASAAAVAAGALTQAASAAAAAVSTTAAP